MIVIDLWFIFFRTILFWQSKRCAKARHRIPKHDELAEETGHPLNIELMFVTFSVFQFEILFNDFNDEHSENIELILLTLNVFHFDISGK